MTMRERILAVYRRQTPDVVPYMLDLSHWFYHKHRLPWDLTVAYEKPEAPLIDYHKQTGAGFYVPNLAPFYSVSYGSDVQAETFKETIDGAPAITWRLSTPLGRIQRTRIWEAQSYSWGIRDWGVQTENDLRVLAYALASPVFRTSRLTFVQDVLCCAPTNIVGRAADEHHRCARTQPSRGLSGADRSIGQTLGPD
jgi:hypothetical protein